MLLGIEAGFLVHLTAASAGFTALLLAIPAAYTVMRIAGGLYLLYIAYRTIRTPHTWRIDDSFCPKAPFWERSQRWLFGTLIGFFALKFFYRGGQVLQSKAEARIKHVPHSMR